MDREQPQVHGVVQLWNTSMLRNVHVPKCGGTFMDVAVAESICQLDPACTNKPTCEKKFRSQAKLPKAHNASSMVGMTSSNLSAYYARDASNGRRLGQKGHRTLPANVESSCGVPHEGPFGLSSLGHHGGMLNYCASVPPAPGHGTKRVRRSACYTMLRDPTERLVSAWLYEGHHPGSDSFGVLDGKWSKAPCGGICNCSNGTMDGQLLPGPKVGPLHGPRHRLAPDARSWHWYSLSEGKYCSATFEAFVSTVSPYSNAATKMFGNRYHAYSPSVPDGAALERATAALRALDFIGLLEVSHASLLLLAASRVKDHKDGRPPTQCLELWQALNKKESDRMREVKKVHIPKDVRSALADAYRSQIARTNELDTKLYAHGRTLFCQRWLAAQAHPCVRAAVAAEASTGGSRFSDVQKLCG